MKTPGSFSHVPAHLVRAAFAVVCLSHGDGANGGDFPNWWDHSGTSAAERANIYRLRQEIEEAANQ